MRDATPVGAVRGELYVPAGYVKANGATANRADFPRLVAFATAHNLWTADTTNNPGLFGEGDGSTTMVLPDWTDRMAQFAATAGGKLDAGLPNITAFASFAANPVTSSSGSFASTAMGTRRCITGADDRTYVYISMDASRSSTVYGSSTTVQPPAIKVFPIIRY